MVASRPRVGSTPLLFHPQGAQIILFGEGVDVLSWFSGSHPLAGIWAARQFEVRLTERQHWMVSESTGPPQTPDQRAWPSPPDRMLRDASLSTSTPQAALSTAPLALPVPGSSDLEPVSTTSQRGHRNHNTRDG